MRNEARSHIILRSGTALMDGWNDGRYRSSHQSLTQLTHC